MHISIINLRELLHFGVIDNFKDLFATAENEVFKNGFKFDMLVTSSKVGDQKKASLSIVCPSLVNPLFEKGAMYIPEKEGF